MKTRELFVFAGQSNMMGAAVYPYRQRPEVRDSYEYLHTPKRRFGKAEWRKAGYACGEYSYIDLQKAYPSGERLSALSDFRNNTHFCPSMYNLGNGTTVDFGVFSEANNQDGPCMAPLFAQVWEKRGHVSAYAHIAKGAAAIGHFFDREMKEEYRRKTGKEVFLTKVSQKGSGEYFWEKCRDFFEDACERFEGEDLSSKVLVWLQGESDAGKNDHYEYCLELLWNKAKECGFTHFFMIRVDYFGDEAIGDIMKAQEQFCRNNADAHMMTRAASFMTYAGRNETEWFVKPPSAEYENCRDSHFGFQNQHINEKGFMLLAERLAYNAQRVFAGKEAVLEPEIIKKLIK